MSFTAALNIPVSLPSPASTLTSASSPIPPSTPLTPNSGHHVSFSTQPLNGNAADQFAFDPLNLEPKPRHTATTNSANATNNGGPARRKPSRRANTAERRATHNAVERQRRETLNGRFLDLAALLPNLASVRRPSKSAIVNSSIALIHTFRRSRAAAARELRVLKLEADALRAEVVEWRERAGMGLASIDEPVRSRDFEELVSGGLEESEEGLIEEERRALEIVKEGLQLDASDIGAGNFTYTCPGVDEEDDESSDSQGSRVGRPGSQGSNSSLPSITVAATAQTGLPTEPMTYNPSATLLQAHPTHSSGITHYNGYDFDTQVLGLAPSMPIKGVNQWQGNPFTAQHTYSQPGSYGSSPSSASLLGGFGLRSNDDSSATPDLAAAVGFDLNHANVIQPGFSRPTLSVASLGLKGVMTPPPSASATVTTYAEAGSAGDAFAAAYGATFPSAVPVASRVQGGGNAFGAAMGLFM